MIINYNVSSMIANNALKRNDMALSKSLERLSSGYKINHAKENAAGLAMARRMNAQLKGIDTAENNASDGISVIEIADGALSEVHDILQRMNELAVKGANGTLADNDRAMIDEEIQALKAEIDRIGQTTQFNGQNLLDGTFDLKGYVTGVQGGNLSIDYYSDTMDLGVYHIQSLEATFDEEGKLTEVKIPPKVTDAQGNDVDNATLPNKDAFPDFETKLFYDEVVITAKDGFELKLTIDNPDLGNANTVTLEKIALDLTGMASMTLQIGSNEGQVLEVRIPPITQKNVGILHTNTLTQDSSTEAIDEISDAIAYVSKIRSDLGAYQNRLEHATKNLDTTYENMTSAYSRIMDVDMAEEMTNYSSLQVLTQAGTSMLAQANERPSQVLQLLQ